MSYVNDQLLPDETVKYRARLHRIIFLVPTIVGLLLALVAVGLFATQDTAVFGVLMLVLAAVPFLWSYITHKTSEFAVTDRRVIIKVGWIQRRTLETMLNKVEGVGVDQGVLGRLLGFGTITVTGTGGTKEAFTNIAAPLEFRRQLQGQLSIAEDSRAGIRGPLGAIGVSQSTPPRQERDCPYCAERILAKARVCKHCNREVEPTQLS